LIAGRYRKLWRVGEGEHGVVYAGEDTATDEVVAIKQQARAQGTREAQLLARLAHPMIPAYKAFHQRGQASYLVMEWIEGQPLLTFSSRGVGRERLGLAEIFQVGYQLCDVLSYLHSQTPVILHLDVNLCNVLRKPDARIMLTDFGKAELCEPGANIKESMSLDTDDVRLLLFKLLPCGVPSELMWQIRGASSRVEDAAELRAALAALEGEYEELHMVA
jgi:serine/threonine protein kinase